MVLEAMRCWSRGNLTGKCRHHEQARRLFRAQFGDIQGEAVIEGLAGFIAVIGRCAVCPLREQGAAGATDAEVLLLGLIAGIQLGDDRSVERCLDALTCPSRCEEVAHAAAVFAITLRVFGRTLSPASLRAADAVMHRRPMMH